MAETQTRRFGHFEFGMVAEGRQQGISCFCIHELRKLFYSWLGIGKSFSLCCFLEGGKKLQTISFYFNV